MVSFTISIVTLALAALTAALPVAENDRKYFVFGLQAKGYPYLSLNAIDSGVIGNKDLLFERPFVYAGTPAFLNGTILDFHIVDPNQSIDYYSANIQGYQGPNPSPVSAIFGNNGATKGFSISNGFLVGPNDAHGQGFFACNTTLQGVKQLGLKYGPVQKDAKAHEGCVAAKIIASHYRA